MTPRTTAHASLLKRYPHSESYISSNCLHRLVRLQISRLTTRRLFNSIIFFAMRFRSMIVFVAMSLFLAAHGAPAIDLLYARSYSLGSSDNPSRSSPESNARDGPDVAHSISNIYPRGPRSSYSTYQTNAQRYRNQRTRYFSTGYPSTRYKRPVSYGGKKFSSTSSRKSPLGVQKPVAAGTLAATTTMNAEGKMANTQHPTTPQPHTGTVGTHLPAGETKLETPQPGEKAADPHHLPGSQPHPASSGTPSHAGLETPQTEGKTPDSHHNPNSQLSPGSEKLEGAEAKAADAHHAAGSQPLAGETKLETPHPGTTPTPEHPDASKPKTEEEKKKEEEKEKEEKEKKEKEEKEKKEKEEQEERERGQRMGDYPGNPYGQEGYGQDYGPPSKLAQAADLATAATQVISTGAEVVRTFKGNSNTNGMNGMGGMGGMGGMDVWEEGEEWEEWEEIQWEEWEEMAVAQQAWDFKLREKSARRWLPLGLVSLGLFLPSRHLTDAVKDYNTIVVRTSSSSATIQIDLAKKMF
ncbi:hypothetical protein FB446DRAFT_708874 [Lentinula raphanica]|nr:hypothetical protein FB446DRAFT_708874 [Lentinula raphanica]